MRIMFITLLLCLALPMSVWAELSSEKDIERRQVWARELGRWSVYCVQRQAQAQELFEGCEDRTEGIRSLTAVYRLVRQTGYAREAARLVNSKRLRTWFTNEQRLLELSSSERLALLALSREALLATGDLIWRELMTRVMLKSDWFKAISCELSSPCADELVEMIRSTHLLMLKPSGHTMTEAQNHLDSYLSARLPVLLNSARYLSKPHPLGDLQGDLSLNRPRSLWSLRAQLASLSLSSEELKTWWLTERGTQNVKAVLKLIPLSTITDLRSKITLERMLGVGALINSLAELAPQEARELSAQFHQHARSSVEQFLKFRQQRRNYQSEVSALGVLALSADQDDQRLALSFPASSWRSSELRVTPHKLSSKTVGATGMFSELAIRDTDERRGLYFVRPNGAQLLETELDLRRPDVLQVRYTQDMFAVFPFVNKPQNALLVGLGGGAMVHALRAYAPKLSLDVVEIDPVVVRFAREQFGIQTLEDDHDPNLAPLKVITADGFDFLASTSKSTRYDLIWMDAFLQPHEGTDSTGSPLNLKTLSFLQKISEERLTAQGVIAINLNHHSGLQRDIDTIRAAFPSSTIWQVPETGNYIALGFKTKVSESSESLKARALELNTLQRTPFRYEQLLKRCLKALSPTL